MFWMKICWISGAHCNEIMFDTIQIIPGWTSLTLNNGFSLDLLVDMKGLENYTFDECYRLAALADIDDVTVPFLQLNQLIINKKSTNRPKDQIDVLYLERIRDLESGDPPEKKS